MWHSTYKCHSTNYTFKTREFNRVFRMQRSFGKSWTGFCQLSKMSYGTSLWQGSISVPLYHVKHVHIKYSCRIQRFRFRISSFRSLLISYNSHYLMDYEIRSRDLRTTRTGGVKICWSSSGTIPLDRTELLGSEPLGFGPWIYGIFPVSQKKCEI